MQIIADFARRLQERDHELVAEQQPITVGCAKFACFLKKYAMTPFNEALVEYMAYIIRVERSKEGGTDDNTLRAVEDMREEYRKQCRIFDFESGNDEQLAVDRILNILTKLYKMKHTIEMLHEAMLVAECAEDQACRFREIRVDTLSRKQVKGGKINILQKLFAYIKKEDLIGLKNGKIR